MDTITNVDGLVLQNPLIVGAGICKTLGNVQHAVRSAAAGLELGSIGPKMKPGNDGNNFYAHYERGVLIYTLNALGLPNPGKVSVGSFTREAIDYAHKHDKRIGCNVVGDTLEELVEMIIWAVKAGFDWVTINPACPNKYDTDGNPMTLLYYDLDDVSRALRMMHDRLIKEQLTNTKIWWKSSPDNNTIGYQLEVADVVAGCMAITGWVANNTVPHCYARQSDGTDAIAVRYAGQAGPAVKPKALGDIMRLKQRYSDRFAWIGAGGVTYGNDIGDFLASGADSTSATSAWWAEDGDWNVFGRILGEWAETL